MSDLVIDRVREFAVSLLPSLGLELYDVQFRREGRGWVLRLIIDNPEGVSLDDCSRVSREMSDYLDVEDLIDHAYHLEVSSPGVERELRNITECERFQGEKIRVKLIEEMDGQRVYSGELTKVEDTVLVVKTEEGKTCRFDWDNIRKVRLTL
jgi:ribosome maturation factor RimP